MTESMQSRSGRIITFYSYKGGTGRTMAVANIGWLLASQGLSVLLIDWDFEAPGLHRYFHPFIDDKELSASPGLIDYFVEFTEAARRNYANKVLSNDPRWWDAWTSLLRYTYSLNFDFGSGTLDFVPAGQQGPGYGLRVTHFDWHVFYEALGGGILLEDLKRQLRSEYDYILIDSRTGISDTSGICTVQMPDDLVICFTLNQQSIKGALAVAESADAQRRKSFGEPGLLVWPVPMRIELAEKERLETAREYARFTFQKFLGHLDRTRRANYWEQVEVLYQPFYAYEEILAPFVEKRRGSSSLLGTMEAIIRHVTQNFDFTFKTLDEAQRLSGLGLFTRRRANRIVALKTSPVVYLSYARPDQKLAERVVKALQKSRIDVFWDRSIKLGADWRIELEEALHRAVVVIFLVEPKLGRNQTQELHTALELNKRIIPVVAHNLAIEMVPAELERFQMLVLDEQTIDFQLEKLADDLIGILADAHPVAPVMVDPEDPQKGQWGRQSFRNGRKLDAKVEQLSPGWFTVALEVKRESGPPLNGKVEFHLHPSFPREVEIVDVINGAATLLLNAWGAFTVGAVADGGQTQLELDLSESSSFPELFRQR